MYELSSLGFGPFFSQQLDAETVDNGLVARIAAEHRGAYEVWSPAGAGRAHLAGRLRQDAVDNTAPGVGDWVVLSEAPSADRSTVIERILGRRTVFTRGAAGRETRAQVIAANVDLVFVVCGLDADFNVRRIERYLARIWASGAQPAVILNKADMCPDVAARVAEVERHAVGVPVHVTCALHATGTEVIRACITVGKTVALVGSSGAGKSTLTNALLGEDRQRTGDVRHSDGRGRHITTQRQLVLLPDGGLLLDTPGLRELQLNDHQGLDTVFAQITVLAEQCRFRDCRHGNEPGCAVRDAVESGALDAAHFEHYSKLTLEAEANELRHDEHRRRKAERVWGQLHKEVSRLREWKGGKP
jgi:ribosome biogenesis GTPase